MMRIEYTRVTLVVFVSAVVVLSAYSLGAQSATPPAKAGSSAASVYLPNHRYDLPATLIPAAQIEAVKKKAVAEKNVDVPIKMVKAGGTGSTHQVGVSYNHKLKGYRADTFAIHDDVAEVYSVLEGDAIMQLGGRAKDPQRRPFSEGNGQGITGSEIDGAQEVHIAKGDMLIIPAGTPHKFKIVNEFLGYTVVRIDPDGGAPLSK